VVDAFAAGIQGVPYIVMSSSGPSQYSKIAIRHEYIHVLLGFSQYKFPPWYHEAIAEYMSGTEFRKSGSIFTVGEPIGRQQTRVSLFSWNELISGEFRFHDISNDLKASNAYYQAWLLFHFLMLGDEMSHYEDLSSYLGMYHSGTPSLEAFRAAFGKTPDEFGTFIINRYVRRMPYYTLPFEQGFQDHDFEKTSIATEQAEEIIESVRNGVRWQ